MTIRLKRQFIKLLDEDKEFRYTVAGYLGLGEILKRLDAIEENIQKIWMEIRGLREGQERLWEGQNRLWEGQNKLWENQEKLWEEVKALREGQERLWGSHRRLRITCGLLLGSLGLLWVPRMRCMRPLT